MGSFKVHPHFRWYVHFKGPKRGLFIYLQPASFIFKPDQKMFKPLAGRRPVAEKGVTLLCLCQPPPRLDYALKFYPARPFLLLDHCSRSRA